MPLASYGVERYRCFVDPATIEIRPITLLFGLNSSGKSALARALPLLRDSLIGSGRLPLALDTSVARGATYKEIASRLSERNALVFSLSWSTDTGPSRLSIQLRDMPEQGRHIVEEARLEVGTEAIKLLFEPTPTSTAETYSLIREGRKRNSHVAFQGLRPVSSSKTPSWAKALIDTVADRLLEFSTSTYWLTAVRQGIGRRFAPKRGLTMGPQGENVEHILAEDWAGDRSLVDRVNRSYRVMFGQEVRIDETADGCAVAVIPTEGPPISVALADTGEGASQVLAVLVLGALAEVGRLGPSPLIVVEQPEMHLHPAAELELGAFLAKLVSKGPRIVVETHSENLLLFVQLAVARKQLSADAVSIYYLRRTAGGRGTVVDRIALDESGRPQGWPPGVFSEDVELARKLMMAQRALGQKP